MPPDLDAFDRQPLRLVDAQPFAPMEAYADEGRQAPRREIEELDLAALAKLDPIPKEMAIERLAPAGEVTLLTGPGSAGKSLLAQLLCTATAAGMDCLDLTVREGSAIYLTVEDGADQLHWRQQHICRSLGVDMASLAGTLHLYSLRGELDTHLATFAPDGRLIASDLFAWLEQTIARTRARIVVLDNVGHLFAGNENDRSEVTRFIGLLNRLAKISDAAIPLIAHPNKSGATYSGSTAWLNAVRSQVVLDFKREASGEITDPDARVLRVGKANYSNLGEPLNIRWKEWSFIAEAEMPADEWADITATARATADNDLFLACLDARNSQQRPVSEKESSRTYAPKVFEEMAESKGIGAARLKGAMDRLYRLAIIERGFLWRDKSEGKDRVGLRRAPADLSADLPPTPSADHPPTYRSPPLTHTPLLKKGEGRALGGPLPPLMERKDTQ